MARAVYVEQQENVKARFGSLLHIVITKRMTEITLDMKKHKSNLNLMTMTDHTYIEGELS